MCEITAATAMYIALASTAASAAVSYKQGSDTAKAQGEALADAAYMESNDAARKQSQEASATADQMNQHARQAMQEVATADVVAGEYGGGASANRGLAVMGIHQSEGLATIGANGDAAMAQTRFDSIASGRRASSQIGAIKGPSALGTALQIGAGAASAYSTYLGTTGGLGATKPAAAGAGKVAGGSGFRAK